MNWLNKSKDSTHCFLSSSPHEPLYTEAGGVIHSLGKAWLEAKRVELSGRLNSVRDIEIKEVTKLPIIGIIRNVITHLKNPLSRRLWKKSDELAALDIAVIALDLAANGCVMMAFRWWSRQVKEKCQTNSWWLIFRLWRKDWQHVRRWTLSNDPFRLWRLQSKGWWSRFWTDSSSAKSESVIAEAESTIQIKPRKSMISGFAASL